VPVYLNGSYVPREQALVSVDDRGFVFGDGVYEVIRASNGRLFEPDRHVRRLERSLREITLSLTDAECEGLVDVWQELLRANGLEKGDAIVYVQVTRGVAVRAHPFPPASVRPTVYASASAWTPPAGLRARGARVITVPDVRWSRCDIKTITLLPNVLAKQRAVEAGADEALFVRDGVVLEGSVSNFFAVIDGALCTHPLTTYILGGITRDVVLEIASSAGIPVRETPILLDHISRATELFYTNTTNDIIPIVAVDGRAVGDGRPGPVTGRLYTALCARITAS
jgi:D-alanine transaminase